jgi:uncharacterized membrane protein
MLFLLAFFLFLVGDALWLGALARGFYQEQLGHLMRKSIRWGAALLFYIVYVGGLVLFVLSPSLEAEAPFRSMLLGAAYGGIAYGAYDLTNLATLRDWSIRFAIVDMAWGIFLTSITSGFSVWLLGNGAFA